MKFVKKVTKHQLFLPLFSMVLVMLVNIIYDVANGNAVFNFFTISINNGILYGRLIDILNRGSEAAILALGLEMDAISSAVIGGTLLTGGVGNVFGSFFGVLINGTISSLVKTNGKLSSSWPNVVTALLLCFFIVLQAIFAKVKARRS